MKKTTTININGEDEEITLSKITLIYDGSYGMNKIKPGKDCITIDCTKLVGMYPQLVDSAIDWWVSQPIFVYLWCTMWGGNIANTIGKSVCTELPLNQEEFANAAPNVQHVFALLCALINAQADAIRHDKLVYVKYPELGLHPGVQANLGEVTIMLSMGGFPPWVNELKGKGKQLIKQIITRKEIS